MTNKQKQAWYSRCDYEANPHRNNRQLRRKLKGQRIYDPVILDDEGARYQFWHSPDYEKYLTGNAPLRRRGITPVKVEVLGADADGDRALARARMMAEVAAGLKHEKGTDQ